MTSTSSSASSTADEKAPVEWRVSLASSSMEGFAPGYKSTNQDSWIALPSYGGNPGSVLMGVFDGHGRAGHHVSRFLKEKLPATLLAMLKDPNHCDHPFLDAFENINLRMSTAVEDSAPNNLCRAPSGMGSYRDGVKKCGGICGACKPKCGFDAYNR
jgi:serine/threonine protein phosphatase PrpC